MQSSIFEKSTHQPAPRPERWSETYAAQDHGPGLLEPAIPLLRAGTTANICLPLITIELAVLIVILIRKTK